MPRVPSSAKKKLAVVAALLLGVAALAWWQRGPLLGWYILRGLASAGEQDRAAWAERVAGLDAEAVPGLVALLRRDDPRVCANAEAALAALAKRWGRDDARTAALAEQLASSFGGLATPGREAVLEWYLGLLHDLDAASATAAPLTATADKLLVSAARLPDKGVRVRALILAEVVLARLPPRQTGLYRDLALQGLSAPEAEVRAGAARLAMHPPLCADEPLLEKVVPLLKDPSPEVRRAALLTVGLAEKTIGVDELVPLLQDGDAEVRRLCERALRGRGLLDSHIQVAKLISDRRPGERLQVVHHLRDADDLTAGVLLRLSQDAAPAVRAAAVRFAAEDPAAADFEERLLQMAREDASPTVRQLAAHYLKTLQRRN